MESKLPNQPVAEMTSVNLIEPSEDSPFHNNTSHLNITKNNESCDYINKQTFVSPENSAMNVYISPSAMSRNDNTFDRKTNLSYEMCEMNEPAREAT